jgi:methylated-DNA-[protein]-cysteine S-methyltransferase
MKEDDMSEGKAAVEAVERGLAAGPSEGDAEAAAARFALRAEDEGLVDVAYGTLDTPVGELVLAGTKGGLVRVALSGESVENVLAELAEDVSPRILELPGRLDEARRELDEYFAGRRKRFELSLDWRLVPAPFMKRVLEETAKVPYGSTTTYGDVAREIGSPRAHRAAGSALGRNPIPIVVPCHRVLRSGGVIGNYGGGPEMKRYLLQLEGAID